MSNRNLYPRAFFKKIVFITGLIGSSINCFSSLADSIAPAKNIALTIGTINSPWAKNAPLWLNGNNSQRYSNKPHSFYSEIESHKNVLNKNDFQLGYGIDLIGRVDTKISGDIVEAYCNFSYKKLELFAGRREEIFGVRDTLLTVGPFVNGNNSLPIPKITLKTNDWMAIPFTKGYAETQAYFSHGWFDKNRAVSSPYLHQKYLYLWIGRTKMPISFYYGLIHNVMWSGTRNSTGEEFTSTPADYWSVLTGSSSKNSNLGSERVNALGNHLGFHDIGFQINTKNMVIKTYGHLLYEDLSGLRLHNAIRNSLIGTGLTLKSGKIIKGVVIEGFSTTNQQAHKTHNGVTFFEPDNYFNNSIFLSGWSYQKAPIGNPMFSVRSQTSYAVTRLNNMIQGIHLGIRGQWQKLPYTIKYTYFEDGGNIYDPNSTPLNLYTISIQSSYSFSETLTANAQVGYQWGSLLGNSLGIRLEIVKLF